MKKKMMFGVLSALMLAIPLVVKAQEATNPTEFTLTNFTDATRGWTFKRPTSWTQDNSFQSGVRFMGGDEALEWTVVNTSQAATAYANALKLPNGETKIGIKPFMQGQLSAQVVSTKSTAPSSITGKTLSVLVDRWIFSPAKGKIAMLKVVGPTKVFDWEGNRDMVLSFKLK